MKNKTLLNQFKKKEVIITTGIYLIKNDVNGKVYIGQSKNISRRIKEHKERAFNPKHIEYNSVIHQAMRKYSLANFSFSTIEECDAQNLNIREIYWISFYKSNNSFFGYNITAGGNTSVANVLNLELVNEIKKQLKSTTLTQAEIAKKFNVSQRLISYINNGILWFDSCDVYPIRKYERKNYKCSVCGKTVHYKSVLCQSCLHHSKRVVDRPSRNVLKNEVRKFPFSILAQKYGVSTTTIRRWCNYYNLPNTKTIIESISDIDWDTV